MPVLEDVPETIYTPTEDVKATFQDILTNPEPEEFISDM